MKRKNHTTKQTRSAKKSNKTTISSKTKLPSVNRRFVLRSGMAVGTALLAGGWIHSYDAKKRTLHDLSVIGSGQPVVLQVHDPSCAECRQLKRSTETALEHFSDIEYRIADLTSKEGSAIAASYGAGKVTLLLFDARGNHVGTVEGTTPAPELQETFSRYFKLDQT